MKEEAGVCFGFVGERDVNELKEVRDGRKVVLVFVDEHEEFFECEEERGETGECWSWCCN